MSVSRTYTTAEIDLILKEYGFLYSFAFNKPSPTWLWGTDSYINVLHLYKHLGSPLCHCGPTNAQQLLEVWDLDKNARWFYWQGRIWFRTTEDMIFAKLLD